MKEKVKGAIYGLACGDYLGMPVEYASTPDKVKEFYGELGFRPIQSTIRGNKPIGYYTDDTAMTLCLAQSLIEKGFDTADQLESYKRWAFEGYMSADNKSAYGIGQTILKKLMKQKAEEIPVEIANVESEGGNCALMKCLPIGLVYYKDKEELLDKTIKSALVTHNNSVAVWCCVVYNFLVKYILEGCEKSELLQKLLNDDFIKQSDFPAEILKVIKSINSIKLEDVATKGYSLNTLTIALKCFFETNNYEESVKSAIMVGGDTDTQGAVTGGLAGVLYGYEKIPKDWSKLIMNQEIIENIAVEIYKLQTKLT